MTAQLGAEKPRPPSERDFQNSVLALAQLHDWKTAHFSSTVKLVKHGGKYTTVPDKGATGFPDLVLVKGSRLIFAELKTDKAQLSDAQWEWILAFDEVPFVEPYVWRPKDWDRIVRLLSRGEEAVA